ncbi:RHS repeat-associated core domain-containing protein, partial [Pseudomonadota bacterium]
PRTDVADLSTFEYYLNEATQGNNRARLKRIIDATGTNVRDNIQYSATGKVLSEQRSNGITLSYTYYPGNDRVETATQSDGTESYTSHLTYLATGELETITTAHGTADATTITYGYDDARRLTSITDQLGNVLSYTLDTEGNTTATQVHDSNGVLKRTQSAIFDDFNRLFKAFNADGYAYTQYNYDAQGNVSNVQDANYNTTGSSYDALGRLQTIVDAHNSSTGYQYDDQSNLTQVTDPKGNSTQYQYDDLGNLLELNSPDTGITQYTNYDAAGNLLSQTDANNQTIQYQYDALNRLTQITYNDGTTTVYTYDQGINSQGRLSTITTPASAISYSYDAFGRITDKTQSITHSGTTIDLTTSYQYNTAGQLQSMTYPSGKIVSYQYNNGQLSQLDLDNTPLLSNISQDPFGPINGWSWGSNTSQDVSRQYDLNGWLSSYTQGNTTLGLFYHPNGNVGEIVDTVTWIGGTGFGYDALNRLTYSSYWIPTDWNSQGYDYDANGNRTAQSEESSQQAYQYNTHGIDLNNNRLLTHQGDLLRQYQYDANGNTLSDGNHSFTYDARNRMDSVSTIVSYSHNGLGQRDRKTIQANNETTLFVYDEAGQVVGEYSENGTPIQETVYLGSMPVTVIKDNAAYRIYTDHLNTPRAITDDTNTVVWEWLNDDPFGANLANEDVDGDGNLFAYNLRFAGQYFDEETGLHYNYFRTYDPETGKYLQSD